MRSGQGPHERLIGVLPVGGDGELGHGQGHRPGRDLPAQGVLELVLAMSAAAPGQRLGPLSVAPVLTRPRIRPNIGAMSESDAVLSRS